MELKWSTDWGPNWLGFLALIQCHSGIEPQANRGRTSRPICCSSLEGSDWIPPLSRGATSELFCFTLSLFCRKKGSEKKSRKREGTNKNIGGTFPVPSSLIGPDTAGCTKYSNRGTLHDESDLHVCELWGQGTKVTMPCHGHHWLLILPIPILLLQHTVKLACGALSLWAPTEANGNSLVSFKGQNKTHPKALLHYTCQQTG